MNKEKFTNATVFYKNGDDYRHIFCTNRTLKKTLNKMKRCSWIADIEVILYDFSEGIPEYNEAVEQ